MMVKIKVPATIANVGPGFDSFGLAICLYNTFCFTVAKTDAFECLPTSQADVTTLQQETTDNNLIFEALNTVYQQQHMQRPPLHVQAEINIPVSRGLGSSSTAIVAGLLAGNQLLGNPYTKAALLETAISLEGHPDNVSPAMLGGFVFGDTRQQQSIAWPANWEVFTISPPYPVSTASARQALPPSVSMESAVFNLRKASLLIHALHTQNMQLFSESLTDQLHQPYRGLLIPEFQILKGAMLQTTALGTIISGSGSTMAVFFETQHKQVLTAVLNDLFHAQGWKNFDMQASTVDPMGAGIF